MNIDDFMSQANGYNTDSETITGYFNIDADETRDKVFSVLESVREADKKTDFLMCIDAITETKIEAVVLSYIVTEKLNQLSKDEDTDDLLAPKIAMAVAVCVSEGTIDEDNADKILKVFAAVIGKL